MIITVSRRTGSLGKEIIDLLGQKLGIPIITRDLVMNHWFPEIASKHELHMLSESPAYFLTTSSAGISFAQHLEDKLKDFTTRQDAIIFGLGSQIIFSHHADALHVKIMASRQVRIQRIMHTHSLEQQEAERFLELTDRKHKRYISAIYGLDWSEPSLYDIIINTDSISIEEAAALLHYTVINRQAALPADKPENTKQKKDVIFKHPSEEEFAKILDMHEIEWQYEPRTFPVKWDAEGNVTQAFSPDFYLPRFNTFIELTTMDQKYVSEKKKKVKLLKKLYPGTNINIVFKNDFNHLVKRFKLHEENFD